MHMTFEKIHDIANTPPEVEHPAYRAARMVKALHEQTIAKIDEGVVFLKGGVNVSTEMRQKCAAEIMECDALMARAKHMDASTWAPGFAVLQETEGVVADKMEQLAAADKEVTVVDGQLLPEIGDYDQT